MTIETGIVIHDGRGAGVVCAEAVNLPPRKGGALYLKINLPRLDGLEDRTIRNSNGEKVSSLEELEKELPKNPKPNSFQTFEFEDAWIKTRYWGPVNIREIKYEFKSEDLERTIQLAADLFVEAILEDAISGKTEYNVPRY